MQNLVFVDFRTKTVNSGYVRSQLINDIYSRITSKLTFKQFESTMGGSMAYADKIKRIKRVSKNKQVLALCDQLSQLLMKESA